MPYCQVSTLVGYQEAFEHASLLRQSWRTLRYVQYSAVQYTQFRTNCALNILFLWRSPEAPSNLWHVQWGLEPRSETGESRAVEYIQAAKPALAYICFSMSEGSWLVFLQLQFLWKALHKQVTQWSTCFAAAYTAVIHATSGLVQLTSPACACMDLLSWSLQPISSHGPLMRTSNGKHGWLLSLPSQERNGVGKVLSFFCLGNPRMQLQTGRNLCSQDFCSSDTTSYPSSEHLPSLEQGKKKPEKQNNLKNLRK